MHGEEGGAARGARRLELERLEQQLAQPRQLGRKERLRLLELGEDLARHRRPAHEPEQLRELGLALRRLVRQPAHERVHHRLLALDGEVVALEHRHEQLDRAVEEGLVLRDVGERARDHLGAQREQLRVGGHARAARARREEREAARRLGMKHALEVVDAEVAEGVDAVVAGEAQQRVRARQVELDLAAVQELEHERRVRDVLLDAHRHLGGRGGGQRGGGGGG